MNNNQLLMMRCYEGNMYEIEKLLNTDVNINAQDNNGNTPLMFAIMKGDPAIVDMLLRNGANPDVQNIKGETALIIAASNNMGDIVSVLLGYAANAFLETKNRQDASEFTSDENLKLMIMNQNILRTRQDIYAIGFLLGSGTYGNVYFGRSNRTGIPYGLKFFNAPEYFNEELKTARAMSSELDKGCDEKIVCIHDYSEERNVIVYQLAKMDLYQYIVDFTPSFEQRVHMVSQLIEILYKLHSNNIVHNDLKAENILVINPRSSTIVLADFGSSCIANPKYPSEYQINQCSLIRKSTIYPPETGETYESYNELVAVDLYALGYLIFLLLNVASPFQGDTPMDANDVLKSNITSPVSFIPLSYNGKELDKNALDAFANKVVSYNPSKRFSYISDLRDVWYNLIN